MCPLYLAIKNNINRLYLAVLVMFSVFQSIKDRETKECSLLRGQAPRDLYGLNGSVKNYMFFPP